VHVPCVFHPPDRYSGVAAATAAAAPAAARHTLVGVRHRKVKSADRQIARSVEPLNYTSTCDTSNDENEEFTLYETRKQQTASRSIVGCSGY